ncbi:MAG: hypothetical protein JWQ13_2099 [Ramlibacter sp.]|jgi:hypothetical protein|nr:hypothetical protein [Ramlibacter sp.]
MNRKLLSIAALSIAAWAGAAGAQGVFPQGSIVPLSMVDGAGSLVDPTSGGQCAFFGGYGCYRDDVMLHGGRSVSSSAVFQVLNAGGACNYVALEGLAPAYVTVKNWNEAYPGELTTAFTSQVYYTSSAPASFAVPQGWSTINVTSAFPIASSTQTVRLTCQGGASFQGGFAIAPPVGTRRANPMLVANWLTPDDLTVHWSGNGSLISFSNNQAHSDSQLGYGRTRDIAVTFPGAFGGTLFQVYAGNSTCRRVNISSTAGAAAQVQSKEWTRRNWSFAPGSSDLGGGFRAISLPLTLDLVPNAYNIIKVEPFSTNKGQVSVQCV